MAIMSGYKGRVALLTTSGGASTDGFLHLTSWKVSMTRDEWVSGSYMTTSESSAVFKKAQAGHIEWSGSIEGYMDTTKYFLTPYLGPRWQITLNDETDNHYIGDCKITSMEVENPADGFVTYTGTFRGIGALTITDSTT